MSGKSLAQAMRDENERRRAYGQGLSDTIKRLAGEQADVRSLAGWQPTGDGYSLQGRIPLGAGQNQIALYRPISRNLQGIILGGEKIISLEDGAGRSLAAVSLPDSPRNFGNREFSLNDLVDNLRKNPKLEHLFKVQTLLKERIEQLELE